MKSTKLAFRNTEAIMHMIGQTEYVFGRGVSIAEIANWLKVSKPTAKKFIDKLVDYQMVYQTQKAWRGNHSVQYLYHLRGSRMVDFQKGYFTASYQMFVADVHGAWMKG